MKKYKLLRFGHCYMNADGDFIIGLLRGNKAHGYWFAASSAHPAVFLQDVWVQSRIVPNDGHWIEIVPDTFVAISQIHASGYKIKPALKKGGSAVISKY